MNTTAIIVTNRNSSKLILKTDNGFLTLLHWNVFTVVVEIKPQTQKTQCFGLHEVLIQEEMRKSDHHPKTQGYYTLVLNALNFRDSLLLWVKSQSSNMQLFQNLFRKWLKREVLVLKVNTHHKVHEKDLKSTSCIFGITSNVKYTSEKKFSYTFKEEGSHGFRGTKSISFSCLSFSTHQQGILIRLLVSSLWSPASLLLWCHLPIEGVKY